jgi:DNA invertase Pin-like site-specific DNA recombinase
MARAAMYCRVSTEKQTEGYGLDAQRRILTDYCKREGHSAEFFVDAGISGETHLCTARVPAAPP